MNIQKCIAEIAIQGDQVLSFINCTQEKATYEVIGFNEPKITLVDYRQQGIKALHELCNTGNLDAFAPQFNNPACICIKEENDGAVLIELEESDGNVPDKMLWIAIGIRDSIPVYNYLFERITPFIDDSFAFVALIEIPSADSELQQFESSAFHIQN